MRQHSPLLALARVGAAAVVLIAQVLAASPAAGDSPCSALPYDSTYATANWVTGGYQNHGSTIRATRGNIRTYNGFVANHSNPAYMGAESAWVTLAGISSINGSATFAQVGWAKTPPSGFTFDPIFFLQYSDSAGNPFFPEFYGPAIFAPTVYTYYVRWVPGSGGGRLYQFVANGRHLNWSSELNWDPIAHEAASEVHNFTGDQLPGDRNNHVTFSPVQWSPDDISWFGGTFGTPAGTYFAGDPLGSYPARTSDRLGVIDGSNFTTWDERCP